MMTGAGLRAEWCTRPRSLTSCHGGREHRTRPAVGAGGWRCSALDSQLSKQASTDAGLPIHRVAAVSRTGLARGRQGNPESHVSSSVKNRPRPGDASKDVSIEVDLRLSLQVGVESGPLASGANHVVPHPSPSHCHSFGYSSALGTYPSSGPTLNSRQSPSPIRETDHCLVLDIMKGLFTASGANFDQSPILSFVKNNDSGFLLSYKQKRSTGLSTSFLRCLDINFETCTLNGFAKCLIKPTMTNLTSRVVARFLLTSMTRHIRCFETNLVRSSCSGFSRSYEANRKPTKSVGIESNPASGCHDSLKSEMNTSKN
jgi:hypothetical protein